MSGTDSATGARGEADRIAQRLLTTCRRIAVVGASTSEGKPGHDTPLRMRARGYEIVPVNPTIEHWHGMPAVASVRDVQAPEIVNVFRRAEEAPAIARDAVAAGARALWLQLGITSPEARRIAEDGGLLYLEDRCVNREYERLRREGVRFPQLPPHGALG